MALQHGRRQARVGRIAFNDQAIQDQIRGPSGQTDFMSVIGLPAVFDNHVRMGLEYGDDLFGCRYFLTLNDPPFGLIDHLFG